MSTAASNSWPAPEQAKAFREARLQIRLTESEKRLYAEAAGRQHLSIAAWLRLVALRAARPRDRPADRPADGPRRPNRAADFRVTALQLRLTDEERRAFSEAADRRGLSVSAWLRSAAFQAAKRGLHQTKFLPAWL